MVGDGAQWPLFSLKTVTRWWECAPAYCYATAYNCCFRDTEAMQNACASIIIAPWHPRSIRLSQLTPGRGTFMNNAITVEKCKQHCLCSPLCCKNFRQSSSLFCTLPLHCRVVLEALWFIPIMVFLKNQRSLSTLYQNLGMLPSTVISVPLSTNAVRSMHTTSLSLDILR